MAFFFRLSCKLARQRPLALFATTVSYAIAHHKIFHALKRLLALSLLMIGSCAYAQSTEPSSPNNSARWYLTVSPYTKHYYPKPIHSYVWLVGIERHDSDNSFMGAAFFNNSFGQDSVYLYPWGQSYPNFWGYEKLTAKWSAGLIYGYVEPWEQKVPLNHNGFSPGFVPALSWKLGSGYEAQVSFPGGAGLMFHLQVPLSAAGN